MKKNKLKILIIGAGNIAKQHLIVFDKLIDLKNSWIYSRTNSKSKKLAQSFSMKHIENNYELFIEKNKKNIDGIFILVSINQIFVTSKKILKFKIPVFIEKPPGLDIKELSELNSLSKKYKTSNLVGYNRRYYSIVQKLKKEIKNEKIISAHVEAHERYWILKKKIKDKSYLKNWTYANTSHVLNLLLFLLGDFKKVISISKNNFYGKNIEVNTAALIELKKKVFVTFKSNWNVPGGWLIKIFCNRNTYTLDPLERCTIINKKFEKKEIKSEKYDELNKNGFFLQAKLFLKIINRKKYYNDLVNILSTYKLIKKIFKK